MPSITREQAQKWDAQAQGGFRFDVRNYAIWGEKELRKTVEIAEGRVVEFRIGYRAEYETKTNGNGCKWNVETVRHIPELVIRVWTPSGDPENGVFCSTGFGRHVDLGPAEDKKKYAVLCKLSGIVNTEDYMPGEAA